jgi:DNA-binding transcriptional regulator YbjK
MSAAGGRRNDGSRRDLLIDTALEVIAEHGVAGTTHRRVAAAAGVPLGSTTYYFADLGDLFRAAFGRLADQVSERFEARLAPARTPVEAIDAITDYILNDLEDPREAALSYEFYAYAIRHPEVRSMVEAWFARSQLALGRYFDPETARLVDTMIEGLCTYRGLASGLDEAQIRRALDVLTAARS